MLPPLLDSTASRFRVERISADKAYSTKKILALIESHGAQPLVPFKWNANPASPPRSETWERAHAFFMYHRDEFSRLYHLRSNVETTFSMIKAKFGSRVRSKTFTAQVNEVLCKVLVHNLCVVVGAIYELGTEPSWEVA